MASDPICPRRWHWRVILKFPWKRAGAHINELELRALFTLLRSLARSSGNIGMRFAVLVDSSVDFGIAAEGRSCSRLLNSILRRLMLMCSPLVFTSSLVMWRLAPTPQMNHHNAAIRSKEKNRGKTH